LVCCSSACYASVELGLGAHGLLAVGSGQRRFGLTIVIDVAAAIQVRLGQHIGLQRFVAGLGIDQHDINWR
jgi:hypothetical protein